MKRRRRGYNNEGLLMRMVKRSFDGLNEDEEKGVGLINEEGLERVE